MMKIPSRDTVSLHQRLRGDTFLRGIYRERGGKIEGKRDREGKRETESGLETDTDRGAG